jgi:hypothetical protein
MHTHTAIMIEPANRHYTAQVGAVGGAVLAAELEHGRNDRDAGHPYYGILENVKTDSVQRH